MNALSAIGGGVPTNERLLQDALRRATAAPNGALMLVLHAAALPDAATRPHRSRLARAVLEDFAEQTEGEVFRMRNGDLVLLARRRGAKLGADGLGGILGRLFNHPVDDCGRYLSCWPLDSAAGETAAYLNGRLADQAGWSPQMAGLPSPAGEWPGAALAAGPVWDLLGRATVVHLPSAGGRRQPSLVPLHHALSFPRAMLQGRAPVPATDMDRFMARHLTGALEKPLLTQLAADINAPPIRHAASLTVLARTAPVYLALGLRAIASLEFARFVLAWRSAEGRPNAELGVEIPWIETTADPVLFARIRALLTGLRVPWALTGISPAAVRMAAVHLLHADLFKLEWSAQLASDTGEARSEIESAVTEMDPARIVLAGADSEAAIRWGLGQGIRRFQGPHVEAMLAASRMLVCPQASHCTLTQCTQRAAAIASAGRAGCLRRDVLDGAAPELRP